MIESGSVRSALAAGFRHIDCAECYGNHELVGEVIAEWIAEGGRREELFITNKVVTLDGDIPKVCDTLLRQYRLTSFDLFLVHSICTVEGDAFETPLPVVWDAMMSLKSSGKAKEIGVSNWRIEDLESIKSAATQPACNQVEGHLFLQQNNLFDPQT